MELTLELWQGLHKMTSRALSTEPVSGGGVARTLSAARWECLLALIPNSENLLETFRVF